MFLQQIALFFDNIQNFLIDHWILLTFSGLIFIFLEEAGHIWWHYYHHGKVHDYMHEQEHVLLKLRFPKENLKTPKAMEQVIASLHGTHSFVFPWRDLYLKGKVDDWFSLEMVGRSDGISFYAQVQKDNRKLFESAFFAQYPEVEITESEDYLNDLPDVLPDQTYNIYGTEYILAEKNKEGDFLDVYPIKTYQFFESPSDEQRLDPMATIAEAVSNLKEEETLLIQLIIRSASTATHPHLKELAQIEVDRLMGRPEKEGEHKGGGILSGIGSFIANILRAMFTGSTSWGEHAEEEQQQFGRFTFPTPIENEIVKGIQNKMSKNLFETIFRVIYIDRRDAFTSNNVMAVFGAVTQFSERNMNSFQPAAGSFTITQKLKYITGSTKRFFKKDRLDGRKRRLWEAYKSRSFPAGHPLVEGDYVTQWSVLSAEELATIYHPPGAPIGTQTLTPIEMKKSGPPPSLPIIDH